jgi:hypothetical protein
MATRDDPKVVLRFTVDEQTFSLPLEDRIGYGLTPREAGRLKVLANGVAGTRIMEAVAEIDVEVLSVLAIIAMERSGATPNVDAILDGKTIVACDIEVAPTSPPPAVAEAAPVEDGTSLTSPMILAGTGALS